MPEKRAECARKVPVASNGRRVLDGEGHRESARHPRPFARHFGHQLYELRPLDAAEPLVQLVEALHFPGHTDQPAPCKRARIEAKNSVDAAVLYPPVVYSYV